MITIDEQLSSTKKRGKVVLKSKEYLSHNPFARSRSFRTTRKIFDRSLKNPINSRLVISSHSDRINQERNPELISHVLVHVASHLQLLDGELLSQIPYLDIARQSLEMARDLSPNLVEPYLELGYFEYAICDRSRKALKYFNIAEEKTQQDLIEKNKQNLKQIFIGKIKCYLDLDECDRAREELEKAQNLFPDDDELEILEYELEEYEDD